MSRAVMLKFALARHQDLYGRGRQQLQQLGQDQLCRIRRKEIFERLFFLRPARFRCLTWERGEWYQSLFQTQNELFAQTFPLSLIPVLGVSDVFLGLRGDNQRHIMIGC
jgi:hypothetical protein